MINFSFFNVQNIKSSRLLLWSRNEENILLFNHVRLLCHALRSKFFYLNPFISSKLLWTRFLGFGDMLPSESLCHFWPYPYLCWDARLTQFQRRIKNPRLWMILSWPIDIDDGESIVTARILPNSNYYTNKILSVTHSHGTNNDRFSSSIVYRVWHLKPL